MSVRLVAEEATRVDQVNQWLRDGKLAPVWRYVFLTPKGYGYEEAPPEVKAEASKEITGAAGEAIKGFDLRSVTKGGVAADMFVLVAALDLRVAALPGANQGFLTGVSQTAGARPQRITVAGKQVAYIAPPGGPNAVLLNEGSLEVVIVGDSAEQLKAFASAFIKAHE